MQQQQNNHVLIKGVHKRWSQTSGLNSLHKHFKKASVKACHSMFSFLSDRK